MRELHTLTAERDNVPVRRGHIERIANQFSGRRREMGGRACELAGNIAQFALRRGARDIGRLDGGSIRCREEGWEGEVTIPLLSVTVFF